MGACTKISAVLLAIVAVVAFIAVKPLFDVPNVPQLDEKWWKSSKPTKVDTSIKPFKIHVSDEILQDLKDRLNRTEPFQAPLEGVKQHYGFNTNYLKTIVEFWKTKYDWRKQEKFLNQYPQFITNIQGLNIHFLHVKPTQTQGLKVLPMMILHGWPGSIREFYEIIPLLTKPQKGRGFVYELVIPSLPGYGFSDGAEIPGLSAVHMGVIMKNLMDRLGFQKYYVQGGDWGALIASSMSVLFPDKIIGLHSNMCIVNSPLSHLKLTLGSLWPSLVVEEKYQHLVYPRFKKLEFLMLEFGYFHFQATKPDTIGVALRDSPVGLAAYILQMFSTWTNPAWRDLEDGGLTKQFTLEQLLDNVMIYWVTRSITTSVRLYAETVNKATMSLQIDSIPIEIPSSCSRFEIGEPVWMPESLLRDRYKNLVHITSYNEGGHFAALEVPQLLAKDVMDFTEKVENMSKTKT